MKTANNRAALTVALGHGAAIGAMLALVSVGSTAIITESPLSFIGPALAQQTGSPGGSGNQGTSTGPGATARTGTQNQNRAGGGNGGGGGGTGGVPSGTNVDRNFGGAGTEHGSSTTRGLAPGWCSDLGEDGVQEQARFGPSNLNRLNAAMERVGGAPAEMTASARRDRFAAYQRALEATPKEIEAAGIILGSVTTQEIGGTLIGDLNATLCVDATDEEKNRILSGAKKRQASAGN